MDEQLTAEERREMLKYYLDKATAEIDFLRLRQDRTFGWTASVLVAFIGLLVVTDSGASLTWPLANPVNKVIACAVILGIAFYSISWQQKYRHWQNISDEVRVRIQGWLHCFDPAYYDPEGQVALMPPAFGKVVGPDLAWFRRVFRVNYVSATALLGIMAALMAFFHN